MADAAFVLRVQAGEHTAFGELFDQHYGIVFWIGFRVLGNAGDADDLVQEVFLYLFRSVGRYDPHKGTLSAWVVRATWHRALNMKVALARVRGGLCLTENHREQKDDPERVACPMSPQTIESDLKARESVGCLARMGQVFSVQAEVIRSRYFDGKEYEEIAMETGCSVQAVRQQHSRGLKILREILS